MNLKQKIISLRNWIMGKVKEDINGASRGSGKATKETLKGFRDIIKEEKKRRKNAGK